MRKTLKTVVTAVMALALAVTAVPNIAFATESSEDAINAGKEAFDPSGETEYHAYFMFQADNVWVYRNSYSEPETGREWENFNNVVTSLDVDDPVVVDGTVTDAVITGNGTYTVKVEGLNGCIGTDENTNLTILGVSTDIPNDSDNPVTISDVKVKIDNVTQQELEEAIIDDEEMERSNTITVLCANTYRNTDELSTVYQLPNDSMEITFTVSGFDVDNEDATEETAAPAASDTDTDSSDSEGISTPAVVAIVVVVVVVVVAVVAVTSKKKKKN